MARIIYKNAEGKRVPGVTTILANLGWNKNPLMWWAWNEGIEGRDYKDTSQKAADIGTFAHALIEADLKSIDLAEIRVLYEPKMNADQIDKANNAYLAWLEWKELVDFELIGSEMSLVSELFQCGGTIDIAAIKKKRAIVDLKTSNGVYPDHLAQIAAYGAIYNENFPDEKIDGYYLLRLGKGDGSFHYHFWHELFDALEAFKHASALHAIHKFLRKMV